MKVDPWGVVDGFKNAHEQWQQTPDETRRAIHGAMGGGNEAPRQPSAACVVRQGITAWTTPGTVKLEDGGELKLANCLPADLPLGYHWFTGNATGTCQRLIVCPRACVLPERGWGWATQLYATRSSRSWGIGDFADLGQLAAWGRDHGSSFLLVNPLGAVAPTIPQESSPYYPTSRVFRNPIYIAVENVPAAQLGEELAQAAVQGRKMNSDCQIRRDEVFRVKQPLLEKLWERFAGDRQYDQFLAERGESLKLFGIYCVLVERHGRDWHRWPSEYQSPAGAALERIFEQDRRRVDYHRWLQWVVDVQLERASSALKIVQDLPIGVDAAGFDAWRWQEVLAAGVSVGAPPDIYNVHGQNWGLPPFVPHKLRTAGYEPFVETIRAVLQHAGGLRIDHVMGLFRLFWIPNGMSAQQGAFVRYAHEDLLGIIALESHRAGAFVVGEDLGTVEPEMREALASNNMLSYRLLWFEDDPPATYPELALAAVSTHDLPTIAGVCSGSDFATQERLGMKPDRTANDKLLERLSMASGCGCDVGVNEMVLKAHAALASAPSLLITATLDDALAVEERPNMPGTTDSWPNWSIALPATLEEICEAPAPRAIAHAMSQRRRE